MLDVYLATLLHFLGMTVRDLRYPCIRYHLYHARMYEFPRFSLFKRPHAGMISSLDDLGIFVRCSELDADTAFHLPRRTASVMSMSLSLSSSSTGL